MDHRGAHPHSEHASAHTHGTSALPAHPAALRSSQQSSRNTKQREAVSRVLRETNAPISAKQILTLASKHAQGMGLATVYRTLKLLIELGEAKSVDIPGMTPLFEIAGKGHHHHFVCTACDTVFELEGACCGHFDDLAPAGFQTMAHELSLYGTCEQCTIARKSTPAKDTRSKAIASPRSAATAKSATRPRTSAR